MFLKALSHMPLRASIVWNTTSQIVGKLFTAGTTFLVTLLIARQFGAVGYGDFVKITTYVAFFFLIADFGLNAIYIRKEKAHEGTTSLFPVLLGIRITGSIFLVFLSLAILAFIPHGTDQGYTAFVRLGIILFSPAIIFQALITSANAVFQKKLRYDLATASIVAGSVVTLLFLWVASLYLSGIVGVFMGVLSVLAGSAVTACMSLLLTRREERTLEVSFAVSKMKEILVPSIPLGLTLLFNLIYFHIDGVVLALTRATSEVGIYGLAYKVFEIPLVIPTFFMNALYPFLLKETENKNENTHGRFFYLFKRSFVALVLLSLLLSFVLWVAAPYFTLIRQDFSASIWALRVLSLGLPFFFLSSLVMWSIIALGKQSLLLVVYGASMVLNILLTVLLVPSRGYVAAAWITVFSEGLVLVVSGFMLYRLFRSRGTIAKLSRIP